MKAIKILVIFLIASLFLACAADSGSSDLVDGDIGGNDNSADGSTWTQATNSAAWSAKFYYTSVVYDNKLWVLGGLEDDDGDGDLDSKNDVWFSEDGASWTQATSSASWSIRSWHSSVVFDDKLWVLGGVFDDDDDGDRDGKNDVWFSEDGASWTQATSDAAWSARGTHSSVVFDNKLWVLGGGAHDGDDFNLKNDVWFSADGASWTQATSSVSWSARFGHTSVVFDNKLWVLGGFDGVIKNDVWFSADGVTWTQATSDAAWSARYYHSSVVFDNKIWVLGGLDSFYGDYKNDVWFSTDGSIWTQATNSAAWSARSGHTSVVFDNKLWVLGGFDGVIKNDVWYATACVDSVSGEFNSGNNCSSGNTNPPDLIISSFTTSPTTISANQNITLSAVVENSGGQLSNNTNLRYYRSSNNIISPSDSEFTSVTDYVASLNPNNSSNESAQIAGHNSGTAYYGVCVDSVSGESDTSNNCSSGVAVSVRASGNTNPPDLIISSFTASPTTIGANQNITLSAVVENSGGQRSNNTNLRYYRSSNNIISPSDSEFTSVTDYVASLNPNNSSNESAQIAGHNSGTAYYGVCVDSVSGESDTSNNCSSGVAVSVRASGNTNPPDLIISSFTTSPTTISANQNITLSAVVENSGGQQSNSTNLRYYRSSNNIISPSDSELTSVTDSVASLNPNNSSNESAQIAGHNSGTAYYGVCVDSVSGESDTSNNCSSGVAVSVANSVAEAAWTQATSSATWSARAWHSSVVFDDKLWVLGGYDVNISAKNDVWFSADGITWTLATSDAAWSARWGHSSVVFDNKLWVLGGNGSRKNDAWFSEDGSTWTQATSSATWSARAWHSSVVYDDKLWVLGGSVSANSEKNDVWFSEDGSTWTQATSSATWSARDRHTSVVFDNKLWVLGGGAHDGNDFNLKNDVWFSADGSTWTRATSNVTWSARTWHTSVVYDDKLWVLGGYDGDLKNDAWFSEDGSTWMKETSSTTWVARYGHSSVAFDNKLWVLGGIDGNNYKNDVWYLD